MTEREKGKEEENGEQTRGKGMRRGVGGEGEGKIGGRTSTYIYIYTANTYEL